MTELEKATWEFLFDTPSVSLLKYGSPYSDFVEAVTSDREKAFIAGAQWQKQQMIDRAVEWLKAYIHYDDFGGNMEWLVPFENDERMIQHFKTYMEE